VTYCAIPRELAPKLHNKLGLLLEGDAVVELIVERRTGERRSGADRRDGSASGAPARDRRRIRSATGRRYGERRAAQIVLSSPPLPPALQRHRRRVTLFERVEPAEAARDQVEAARLVARVQAGDMTAFEDLYDRYFPALYRYLRMALQTDHEAEDATQQVFVDALEAIPGYEQRSRPFRAWLFRIARNQAVDRLRERGRLALEEPGQLELLESGADPREMPSRRLADQDMLRFIRRLPLAQQQVVVLRYMLDFTTAEIAEVLGRSPQSVRQLQSRALRRLERHAGHRDSGAGRLEARPMRLALTRLVVPRAGLAPGLPVAGRYGYGSARA
jgi:RNA polymerase sigma-70 factor (ECF subfamily)